MHEIEDVCDDTEDGGGSGRGGFSSVDTPPPPVDLRSDTVTRPSDSMRRAMAEAEVGDDVFGEDPTVARLQRNAAKAIGHEAALFLPSGTMANLVAMLSHCRPGDSVIVGRCAHSFAHEAAGGAAVAGVQLEVLGEGGHFTAEALEEAIHLPDPSGHVPATQLVMVENTHNRAGGKVLAPDQMRAIAELCRRKGLALHLDGARLFNAAVARNRPAAEWGRAADSVAFCLSKGLGAPAGSLLCGSVRFIARAHRYRKMLGGGMRQIGVLAAAGLFALEHNVDRLADDHRRARQLAEGIAELPGLCIDPESVETNIVIFQVAPEAPSPRELCGRLATHALALPVGPRSVRMVTHLDVHEGDVERVLEALHAALG